MSTDVSTLEILCVAQTAELTSTPAICVLNSAGERERERERERRERRDERHIPDQLLQESFIHQRLANLNSIQHTYNIKIQHKITLIHHTYIIKSMYYRSGVEFAHNGMCSEDDKEDSEENEDCPSDCTDAELDGPICASNGNVYNSTCDLKYRTCG